MPKADFAKLLDDFIGDREQLSWDLDAKRSRRLQIDDKFKFVRLQNGQFARLGPLENAACIDTDLTKHIGNVGSVAHQTADCDHVSNA